jgi:hypothetical protein
LNIEDEDISFEATAFVEVLGNIAGNDDHGTAKSLHDSLL